MAEAYGVFASYLKFKEVLSDPLGHLYRAGEFDATSIKRIAWLRVFDRPLIDPADLSGDFDRAQAIASAVQSANVSSNVDCITHEGTPALAFEYTASQPLSLVLNRVAAEQFPIPVDNALLIAEKIALALAATLTVEIGNGRVVHGFLHPGLIFVTNDGEAIVSGFGIGEHLLALVDDQTSADAIHPYLAPEMLQSRAASQRGDVYAVGAILFHLLTGAPLPPALEERAEAIAGANLAFDEEQVPGDIKSLLQRALAQHPEERFSSAADFKKELDRLLYGGAYSPTTFNLALFMDRLFRPEIEAEEAAVARERAVDVKPYVTPVVTPEPIPEADTPTAPFALKNPGPLIGIGAAGVIVIAAVLWFTVFRGPSTPPPPPTPTAAEIAAQRQQQEEKMRELAAGLVAEMMAAKEEEIRQELLDRQAKIDDLQRRLAASERQARQGQLSREDVQRREELQRQIAAEEEAQRQREAELEAERLQAEQEAQQQAMAQQTATAVAVAAEAPSPTLPPAPTTAVPTARPTTAPPTAVPTPVPTAVPVVVENSFVDPTGVDSPPAIIKKSPVVWSRAASFSRRQGVVVVQVTVDAYGNAKDATILRADHEGFGIPQAVKDAVMKYRFKPGTKDGVPITTYLSIVARYNFTSR
jgi:TonB family protein